MTMYRYKMTCNEVRLLMVPVWVGDSGVTEKERQAFEAHLLICSICAEEYRETRKLMPLLEEYWGSISEGTLKLLEKAGYSSPEQSHISRPGKHHMTVEEGWENIKRRIPKLVHLERRYRLLQVLRRIGAAAACLLIGALIWLVFLAHSKPGVALESTAKQVTSSPKAPIKIEVVSETGNIVIPTDHQITAAKELKNLIINDKHKIALNYHTVLKVEPLIENSRLGCLVKLTSGEIFADVEHDGSPFVVSTAHGRAFITGTSFDVKVADTTTTLVVTEGTVQFESEKDVVQVAAGQTSEIVGRSAPTKPISCNTTKLTAWVTGPKPDDALAQIKPTSETYDIDDSPLFAMQEPIDLESINYDDWVEQKRDWFKREFPWIFQVKDALAKEGIKVDYPELLIQSGDVCQFVYPPARACRIPVPRPDSLRRVISRYGFNEQWLLKNVPLAKSAIDASVATRERFSSVEALEKWAGCLKETQKSSEELDSGVLLDSLHASTYLSNTKTLVWLSIRNRMQVFKAPDETAVLALLQREVNAANDLSRKIVDLLWKSQNQPCCENQGVAEDIIQDVNAITSIEKGILEYERHE